MIDLDSARAVIAGTRAKGREMGLAPLTVVVLDAGGHLVAMEREDGAAYGRPEIAQGKAAGALAMGIPSRRLGEMAEQRPQFVAALSNAWHGNLIPAAGGVLIRSSTGTLIGAVGVTGDLSDKDEEAAIAGIGAAGLTIG
ncbi:heme-binding protein (plasmid) [Novosphingobium sp. BL-8A]|uniref:GlcG/HbpS family heme-binding protein n=1 Tax=Novosphingobium sp. BL-8A TaxID=3127639 RepID=UPI003756E843